MRATRGARGADGPRSLEPRGAAGAARHERPALSSRSVRPGAIVLGAAIGTREWLIGPAVFVRYGLALLWVTLGSAFFQALFNTELVRYTLYTGEPVIDRLHAHEAPRHLLGLALRRALSRTPAAGVAGAPPRLPCRGRCAASRGTPTATPTSRGVRGRARARDRRGARAGARVRGGARARRARRDRG